MLNYIRAKCIKTRLFDFEKLILKNNYTRRMDSGIDCKGERRAGMKERKKEETSREKKKTKEQQVSGKVNDGRNRSRSHFKFVFPW